MKMKVLGIFTLVSLFVTGLSAFDITGKTAVILPAKPLQSSILAADEMAKYVEKVSGIKLAKTPKGAKSFIYIGLASDFQEIPSSLKKKLARNKAEDAYIFYVKGNKMFFAGKEKTAELYAVYQFLDRELGIRFLKPANKFDPGEYIPYKKRSRIVIKDQSLVRIPVYTRRILSPTAWDWTNHPYNGVRWSVKGGYQMRAGYYHKQRSRRINKKQIALYAPRTQEVWEDSYHNLFQESIPAKKYFKTHPQYFALVNGKRRTADYQNIAYCMSNPEVRKLVAQYIIKNIKEKKAKGITFMQGAGLSDMSRGWCECENCLKENGSKVFDWRNISNIYNRTFKAIFAEVYKEIPDARLMVWGYHTYRIPPAKEIKHDPRTLFCFMPHGRCYAHSMGSNCHRNTQLTAWMRNYIARNKISYIYDYFLCSGGRNYVPHELMQAEDIRFYNKEGVTGWVEEVFFEDSHFWRKNVDSTEQREKLPSLWQWLYLTGKMLWDPSQDPVKLLNDAESKYYGKAYPAMKKYHALRRKLWKETPNCFGYPFGNERMPLLLNNPADKERLFALLKEGEKLAGKDKVLLYRLGLDRKFLTKYWVKANDNFRKLQGKVIKAPAATGKIVIDGKDDEAAWKRAFYIQDFTTCFQGTTKGIPSPKGVNVGVLSDGKFLYFLIKGKEPMMQKLQKGKNIWEKSSAEIFIYPQTASNEYYHMAFALDGEKYEARCPGNIKFNIGAQFKCRKLKDEYIMEIKVPASIMGDFKNGVTWKCNIAVNRFVFTDKLYKAHFSLTGPELYHDITRFLPLQIGTPITINGLFNKVEKNKRKYPAHLKVLEKVPSKWYASLPQKGGAIYGIKMEKAPYEETLYIAKTFANYSLPRNFEGGDKLTFTFEAKGKGLLSCGLIRYRRKTGGFIKTEYPAKAFQLTDKWQRFSFTYTVKKDETMHFAFNAFRCEAQVDNLNITVQKAEK